MSTSKTAEAAAKAVKKSQQVQKGERTPEQILSDFRKNLTAGLAVTPEDQRFLLALYDSAKESEELLESATATITKLQDQVEQFRTVYEQENRSQSVRIERVSEPELVPPPPNSPEMLGAGLTEEEKASV